MARNYHLLKIFNKDNFKNILDNGNLQIKRKKDKIESYAYKKDVRTEQHQISK